MRSRLRFMGHPLHVMLVDVPIGALLLLVLFDLLYLGLDHEFLWRSGFYVAVIGLIGGAAAIGAGLFDYFALERGTKAKRVANWHLLGGLVLAVVFLTTLALRWPVNSGPANVVGTTVVDVVGAGVLLVQGWTGAHLIYQHHVGVRDREEGGEPVRTEKPPAATPERGRRERPA